MAQKVSVTKFSWWAVIALAASFALAALWHTPAHADEQTIPYRINFQGRLTNSTGNPMTAGMYNMRFRIYTAETGGSLLWSGQRSVSDGTAVKVSSGGLFSAQLGKINTMEAEIFSNPELYFEIELPTPETIRCATTGCESYTEGPMSPRRRFLSSPYAFNADQLDGIDSTAFSQLATNNTWTGSANSFAGNTFGVTAGTSVNFSSPLIGLSTSGSTLTLNGTGISLSGASMTSTVAANVFQNVSNSTSAFTIARAGSGGNLFVADTTNARIHVGNATPDGNTVLLVVDNSSAATDPAGTNGAIYYNTAMGVFRCYQNGQWTDCISRERTVASTANQVATASTTSMQNVSGMTVPLEANSTYSYDVVFMVNVSNTSADLRYTLTSPSGSTLSGVGITTTGGTAQTLCTLTSASGTTCSVATATAARIAVSIRGTVVTSSTAGSLQLRFAQNSAQSASSPTALAGSTIRYQKLD